LTVPVYLFYLFKSGLDIRKSIYKASNFLQTFYKFNKIKKPPIPEKKLAKRPKERIL